MRYVDLSLRLLALGLGPAQVLGSVRRDFGRGNVRVVEITPGAVLDYEEHEIIFPNTGLDFEDSLRCNPRMGKRLTLSADRRFAACCRPGEVLAGSRQTGHACVPAGRRPFDDYDDIYQQTRLGQGPLRRNMYDDYDDVYQQTRRGQGPLGRSMYDDYDDIFDQTLRGQGLRGRNMHDDYDDMGQTRRGQGPLGRNMYDNFDILDQTRRGRRTRGRNLYDDYNDIVDQTRRGQGFRGRNIMYDDYDDIDQTRRGQGLRGRGFQGEGVTQATRCPPGQPWRDGSCLLPINDCADRAHPELGDTSYNPADFPCSAGRERPCRGPEVQDWQTATLYWVGSHQQPGPPAPYETTVDFDTDVVMTLVDVETQGGHYLVRLDGLLLGETGGERGYKNAFVGYYNDPEWCLANGYSRGYFRIPKGEYYQY